MKTSLRRICLLCFPKAEYIGKVSSSSDLMLWKGQYHILSNNGHTDDISFSFPIEPRLERDIVKSKACNHNIEQLFDIFDDAAKVISHIKNFATYRFIKELIDEKRYDPEKDGYNFEYWLFIHCAKLMRRKSKRKKKK